jgi:N6-adenosine-specific RNA methylase IME4
MIEQAEAEAEQLIIKISDIKIGNRLRKKVGDVSSLAASISSNGLLHPVVIDENNELIGGARRIAAYKLLGRDMIPYRRINSSNPMQAEYDENVERSNFALEDIAEIYKRVQASRINHRPPTSECSPSSGSDEMKDDDNKVGNLPTNNTAMPNNSLFPKGATDFVTGKICNRSEQTVNKIVKIVNSAKNNPQIQEIVDRIDNGKTSIDYGYKQVLRLEDRDRLKLTPPKGQYEILYIDPPWSYDFHNINGTPEDHYPTMTDEEIMQMVVPAAEEKAVLFLWVPYPKNQVAFDVIASWGFEYKSKIIWVKDKLGIGHYVRAKHEELFISVKNGGFGIPVEQDRPESVIFAERGQHSKKPEIFYELIERMYPERTRIELFARGEPRNGWDSWGLEAKIHNALANNNNNNNTASLEQEEKPHHSEEQEDEEEEEEEQEEDSDLARFRSFGRPIFQNDSPRLYNYMNFVKVDPRLGRADYPGNIAGQIVMNVLYYYTKPMI